MLLGLSEWRGYMNWGVFTEKGEEAEGAQGIPTSL